MFHLSPSCWVGRPVIGSRSQTRQGITAAVEPLCYRIWAGPQDHWPVLGRPIIVFLRSVIRGHMPVEEGPPMRPMPSNRPEDRSSEVVGYASDRRWPGSRSNDRPQRPMGPFVCTRCTEQSDRRCERNSRPVSVIRRVDVGEGSTWRNSNSRATNGPSQ